MHRIDGIRGVMAAAVAVVGLSLAVAAELVPENSARQEALAQVEGGRVVHSEMEVKKDGRTLYEYTLVDGESRVKIEIDGLSGEMVKFDKKPIERLKVPPHLRGVVDPDAGSVGMARAREIALGKVGGGEVVRAEKDFKKHGEAVYKVEVISGGMECKVEIDADTGDVVHYKEKRLDDDDRKPRGPKHHKEPKHPKRRG